MTKDRIIIASGGTGGHVFPAQVVYKYLEKKGLDVVFISDARAKKYFDNGNYNLNIIPSSGFANKGLLRAVKGLWLLEMGILKTILLFVQKRPKAVILFGGYVSLAPFLCALSLRSKILIHEQNKVAGRANRLFAKLADAIFVSFSDTKYFEGYNTIVSGMPIREEFINNPFKKSLNNKTFNNKTLNNKTLNNKKKSYTVAIFGGSLGARVFNERVVSWFDDLDENIKSKLVIYHQCKSEDIESIRSSYEKSGFNEVYVDSFFTNVADILRKARFVVSRSGAGIVAEIVASATPAIYVPLPDSVDNHQFLNAQHFSQKGCAMMVNEHDEDFDLAMRRSVNSLFTNSLLLSDMVKLLESNKLIPQEIIYNLLVDVI